MAKMSETTQSTTALSTAALSHRHLPEDAMQVMTDAQEAEAILFQYIVTSAGQLETPPVILKKLAANLGDPQRLPAAKILQTTMGHPLSHPLTTLIAIEGLLEGAFEDSAASFEKELAALEETGHTSAPWISVTFKERHDETIEDAIISDTPLAADPLIDRKPQKLFPAGRILVLSIAIIYGYLVFKTGYFSPTAIWDSLRQQRASLLIPEDSTPREISPNSSGMTGPDAAPETVRFSQEGNEAAPPANKWQDKPQSQRSVTQNGMGMPAKHHDERPQESLGMHAVPPEHLRDHPGVVTLPGEEKIEPEDLSSVDGIE